jgi:hypothetical protein
VAQEDPLFAVLQLTCQYYHSKGFSKRAYPILASRLLGAFLAFTANAVARSSTANSAEISRAMTPGEIRAVASSQSEAEERGDKEHVLHIGRLGELVETS